MNKINVQIIVKQWLFKNSRFEIVIMKWCPQNGFGLKMNVALDKAYNRLHPTPIISSDNSESGEKNVGGYNRLVLFYC